MSELIIRRFLALVRSFGSVLCDQRNCWRREANDMQSETSDVNAQPQIKRRKVRASLCVNSKYVERINGWLVDNEITTIGIYGMGGIGKTTLAKQLHTMILNHDMLSTDIHAMAWVSMEMDFTVYQLQQKIADAFGLDLHGDKDENRRAAMLWSFLSLYDKCILFLDDLWGDFRREDIGIPKQCKLILISQSLDVCRILRCQKVIKVEPLSEEESWQLFLHSVAYGISDSKVLCSVRKLVYKECAGLPLAITILAKSWREVIEGMDSYSMGPTQLDRVFCRLKLSYKRLNIKVQRCFLYSALYPKDYAVSKEELIRLWIGEGIIDDVPSLQAQYDMGHTILNKLLNSCLLETCQNERSVKMHDLVRRMALSIGRDNFMVNGNVPSNLEFCRNLRGVPFINSSISLIPLGTFLKCTNLSILLLRHNPLEVIPESFFLHMHSLRVLILSGTCIIRLPSSISALEELQVLDLSSCQKLKQVPPPWAKLHELRILDLSDTAVEWVPRSLEMLTRLTVLDLPSFPDPEKVPRGLLSALTNLKRLSCHASHIIHELRNLNSLEILDAKFDNILDLSVYVRSEHWLNLESFHLRVGCQKRPRRSYSRGVSLHGCSLSGQGADQLLLPYDIRELCCSDSYMGIVSK